MIAHAFRTAANAAIHPATDNLGSFGGTGSYAFGINDAGQAVGSSYFAGDVVFHAFRTAINAAINPATDDLGTLGGANSSARGINDSGQVVGSSSITGDAVSHAFIYTEGVMYDLNTLIPAGSGWIQLTEATAINRDGQIAGYGTVNSGELRAFRLDPVPGVIVGIMIDSRSQQPPTINSGSNKNIPVAILSTAALNAATSVSRTSLTFGRTGNEASLLSCDTRAQDANRDGFPDLVCNFRMATADFQIGDVQAILKGWTVDGLPIRGTGAILVRK